MMLPARLPLAMALTGLALAWALTAAWPTRYAASASVLLPAGAAPGSRILRIEYAARDAAAALRQVEEALRSWAAREARLLDPAVVRPQRPSLALNLTLGGCGGLAFALALAYARRRRRVRISPGSTFGLCQQLLAQWFTPQRQLLAVVGAAAGEGRSRLAAQLAVACAELGQRTLLIDADLRAPSQHLAFGLPNRGGLADFLQDRRVSLAAVRDNLSVMVAGHAQTDPLELLSRERLPAFLAEARRHFGVILIDTPAAQRGPDFEIFAALAGGALVVGGGRLEAVLERCGAKMVARA